MFITNEKYLSELKDLLGRSEHLDMAIAFWGEGAQQILTGFIFKETRLICNLLSGGTNPNVIRELIAAGLEVRQLDNLHAKVIIGSDSAIVGSANFSANGLQLEGPECVGWSEAGLLTDSPEHLDDIRTWFKAEWVRSVPISEDDLSIACERWKKRRHARPQPSFAKNFLDLHPDEVRDRNACVVVWCEKSSEDADVVHEKIVSQAKDDGVLSKSILGDLSFFEDWESLPKDTTLISFHRTPKGKYKLDGIWIREPRLDAPLKNGTSLQTVAKAKNVLGYPMGAREKKEIQGKFAPAIANLWSQFKGEYGAAIIPLDQVFAQIGTA